MILSRPGEATLQHFDHQRRLYWLHSPVSRLSALDSRLFRLSTGWPRLRAEVGPIKS